MKRLRLQRVRELLKREIGELIRRQFPVSEFGLMTVNAVEITADLKSATVYVGILGPADRQTRSLLSLKEHRNQIQEQVGRDVALKNTPRLRFVLDDSIERGNRVLSIIDEIERSSS
jgi:ribosome-binding factor A